MFSIDKNPECQLHLLKILSHSLDPENKRKKVKKSSFQILNAIFLITKRNLEKGRTIHFPGIELICKVAKIKSRRIVSEFINSSDFSIFCSVRKKDKFTSHEYELKPWVFDWFRVFWRFGMMKHYLKNYRWWQSDFCKRIEKWLIPLVQEGISCRQIYNRTYNRLSTEKSPKVITRNPTKVNTIKPAGGLMDAYRETKYGSSRMACIQEVAQAAADLQSRFFIKEGDIHWVINNLNLKEIKGGIRIREERNGWITTSPIKGFMSCVKIYKQEKKRNRWT